MQRGVMLRFSLATVTLVVCFAALNFFGDWTLEMMPIKFVGMALCAGFAYLFAVSNFPALSRRKVALLFWTVAIVLRLLVLSLPPSDELWRFAWDGKVQSIGVNPYAIAPDNAQLAALHASEENWSRIRNANEPTHFAPGAEIMFRLLSAASTSPWLWKIVFALADLGVAGLLLLLFRGGDRFERASWYAWNPLVIYSFAGAAHFDSVLLLALTATILCLVRNDDVAGWKFATGAAITFGLAISINFVAALLVLPVAFALRKRAVLLLLAAGIPLTLATRFGFPSIELWRFAGDLRFNGRLNDLFWWVIEETGWPNAHQRNFSYIVPLVGAVIIASGFCWRNWRRGMLWVLGLTLILMPVLNAWFCTWILPVATWRRSNPWHVLTVTIFAYYLFWNERLFRLPWHAEPWMRGIIIFPPLVAAAGALLRERSAENATEITKTSDA